MIPKRKGRPRSSGRVAVSNQSFRDTTLAHLTGPGPHSYANSTTNCHFDHTVNYKTTKNGDVCKETHFHYYEGPQQSASTQQPGDKGNELLKALEKIQQDYIEMKIPQQDFQTEQHGLKGKAEHVPVKSERTEVHDEVNQLVDMKRYLASERFSGI